VIVILFVLKGLKVNYAEINTGVSGRPISGELPVAPLALTMDDSLAIENPILLEIPIKQPR
jgi:hypothetical protein